jgi:hypothetical protein
MLGAGILDLILGVLFIIAYARTAAAPIVQTSYDHEDAKSAKTR